MIYGHKAFWDIADIVGEMGAERLSIEYGGRKYWLGMREDRDVALLPDLVRCLGVELTRDLIHHYPLPLLEVSMHGKMRARNRAIVWLSRQHSISALARKFGISDRMVRYILSTSAELNDLGTLTQTRPA
jgi:hypothetical protein